MTNIFDGAVLVFECLGDIPGPRFLNGLTAGIPFGGVQLAATADDVELTGNHWQCSSVGNDVYTLACAGSIPGPRYLNGNTVTGEVDLVGDTLEPFSGTRWQIQELDSPPEGRVFLACQGALPDPDHLYLNGETQSGAVDLVPHGGEPFSGTLWATTLVATPSLTVVTRRDLTASFLDITGTGFRAFDRVLFAAEGIVGQPDHLPLDIGGETSVHVDAVGAFQVTLVVQRWPEQPYGQAVTVRATDQHGVSAVTPSQGFSY
jgi:hypothetical protein